MYRETVWVDAVVAKHVSIETVVVPHFFNHAVLEIIFEQRQHVTGVMVNPELAT
jgi:hypothetical protein